MDNEELARELGHFFSEYCDDNAPLNERFYVQAAARAIEKFGLASKEVSR